MTSSEYQLALPSLLRQGSQVEWPSVQYDIFQYYQVMDVQQVHRCGHKWGPSVQRVLHSRLPTFEATLRHFLSH